MHCIILSSSCLDRVTTQCSLLAFLTIWLAYVMSNQLSAACRWRCLRAFDEVAVCGDLISRPCQRMSSAAPRCVGKGFLLYMWSMADAFSSLIIHQLHVAVADCTSTQHCEHSHVKSCAHVFLRSQNCCINQTHRPIAHMQFPAFCVCPTKTQAKPGTICMQS